MPASGTPELIAQLQAVLQRELDLSHQLRDLLGLEREALTHQDLGQLQRNTTDKQQCVSQLETAAKQREQLLQQLQLPVSRAGMEQLLAQIEHQAPHPAIQTLWHDLTAAAELCREENRQLGMLIKRGQHTARQAQQILQRGTPSQNHAYNATGSTDDLARTRSLAKA